MKPRKVIKPYLFGVFGFGIILFILFKTDFTKLTAILIRTDPVLLAIGMAISMVPTVINAMKWKLLLYSKKILIPFQTIFASQMIGLFVSAFLPSRYAGDAYRAYLISSFSGKAYDTVASVILQRLSGLFVLCGISIIGGIFCAVRFEFYELTLTVISICILIILGIGMVFNHKAFFVLERFLRTLRLETFRKHAIKGHESIIAYKYEKRLLASILGLSVLFYLLAFVTVYIICLAIETKVPFMYIVFVLPLIYLLEALPISVNGFGIREGAFVYFFTLIGLQFEQALTISLIILFYRLIKTILGGGFFIMHHSDTRRQNDHQRNGIIPS